MGRAPMQGTRLAAGVARGLAENLRQRLLRVRSSRQEVAVIAVRAVDEVAALQRGHHADARGLLTDIDMVVARHLVLVRGLDTGLFEAADQQHLLQAFYAAF